MQETSLGQLNRSIPCGNEPLTSRSNAVRELKNYLCESLKLRTLNIPKPPISGNEPDVRVAVLFSGGLDCTVLARMMHSILPLVYQIDLLNVAFENPRVIQAAKHPQRSKKIKRTYHEGTGGDGDHVSLSHQGDGDDSPYETCPDRETGRRAFQELNKVCPSRTWRFIAVLIHMSMLLLKANMRIG
jgi:asparagine synthetase B (glutamine-hydrolysing)